MLRRFRAWLLRRDRRTEAQRAMVVIILSWIGGALGLLLALLGLFIHDWNGALQGVAILVLAIAVRFREPS